MTQITSGAELVAKLGESGTGSEKMLLARRKLEEVWIKDHREATAQEITQALADGGAPEGTIAKCHSLMTTGELPRVDQSGLETIESRILRERGAMKNDPPPQSDKKNNPPQNPASTVDDPAAFGNK